MKKIVKLIDFANIEKGTEPGSKSYCGPHKGIRFLRVGDITEKGSETIYTNSKNILLVNENDILMTFDGTPGYVNKGLRGAISSGVRKITPKDEEILNRIYLYYVLQTNFVKNTVIKYTADQNIAHAGKSITHIQIPLPPIPEQKRIVEILEKADNLRKKRQEANELNNKIIQSIFFKMFGDPYLNQKGWKLLTLPDIVEKGKHSIKRGPFGGTLKKEIFVSQGYLVYEQKHAIHNDFDFARYYISEDKYKELEMFKVVPGDLIISCSGVTLGRIAKIPKNAKPGIINQALLKISLDKAVIDNEYFKFLFQTEWFQSILFGVSRGSGIPNFPSISVIKAIKFPVPLLSEQQKFADIVQQIESIKEKQQESEKEINNLFDSLMQKYFNN